MTFDFWAETVAFFVEREKILLKDIIRIPVISLA